MSRTLKQGRWALNIPYFPYSKPVDSKGQPRDPKCVCPLASFDPSTIRGFTPPASGTPGASVRIPIALNTTDDTYEWITPTFSELVELHNIVDPEQLRFFAICLDGQPQHMVIDLDGKVDKWPHLVDQEGAIDAEMRSLFPVFYETQFGAPPDMTRWRADKVPAPATGARDKTSMHINLPSVAFRTQRDMQEFMLRFVRWIVDTQPGSILVDRDLDRTKLNLKTATPIDAAVFSSNRNMRCTYSRKAARGKLPLLPMDPATTREDALWSSLVCYSMSTNPDDWVGYDTHPECDKIAPSSARAKAAKRRAVVAELGTDDQSACKVVVRAAEAAVFEVDCDKGTIAAMPEKTDNDHVPQHVPTGPASAISFLPQLSPENLRKIVWSLSQEKRLFGALNAWRDTVWAIKSVYPGEVGYALAAEWTKIWEDKSGRTSDLAKTWASGRGDSFNVGSLWRWCKEDMEPAAYKALWKSVNPPAVMQAAKQALIATGAQDGTDSCTEALLNKASSLQEAFRVAFTDDEKMNAADELPFKAVMTWWDEHVVSARKALMLDDDGTNAVGVCVLHYCNLFWRFVRLESTVVFYKKSRRAPNDDRAYSWQVTSSTAFQKDLHCNFVLDCWRDGNKVSNVAVRWIKWQDRVTYNSHARVPPTARAAVQPVPTCLNTWVELKVSHARARASAPEGAPNPEWELFKDYICNGFLQKEPNPAVREYFLKWYCSQYVRPGYKLKVACALQSERRQIGKSFMAQILQNHLLGDEIVSETDAENCLEKFNDPVIDKVLVNIEEFTRCRDYNNKLKVLITSDTMVCHPKGQKAYQGTNCLNFWLPSNDDDAFDMKDFAGRIFAVQIGDGVYTEGFEHLVDHHWDYVALARGMLSWWHDPANGCVAADGKTVIWKPESKAIPETTGALNQRIAGEEKHDPVKAWVRAAVNNDVDSFTWGEWMSNAALYATFSKHWNDNKQLLSTWTPKMVTAAVRTLCPAWTGKKHRIDGKSVQCTFLPEFTVARTAFYASQNETEPALVVDDEEDNDEDETGPG